MAIDLIIKILEKLLIYHNEEITAFILVSYVCLPILVITLELTGTIPIIHRQYTNVW